MCTIVCMCVELCAPVYAEEGEIVDAFNDCALDDALLDFFVMPSAVEASVLMY